MSNHNKPVGPSGKPATDKDLFKGETTPKENLDRIKDKDALQDVKPAPGQRAPKSE